MELREQLFERISAAAPTMAAPTVSRVTTVLVDELQMTSMNQLSWVKDSDLQGVVPVLEARALIAALADTANKENQPPRENDRQRNQDQELEDNQNRGGGRTRRERQEDQGERDWNFRINWNDFYNINADIRKKFERGKKLRSSEKRELVKRAVNQVRNKVPGAQRSIFRQIIRDMKAKYAVTFSGELAQGKLGKRSLCKRMQDKFDNDKRPNKKTRMEKEAPSIKAAYGCLRWRVSCLPEDETMESLQEVQQTLKQHFEEVRPGSWNWETIELGMKKTYGLQRTDINKQALEIEKNRRQPNAAALTEITLTETLRDKWPFLTVPRIMLQHFQELTNIDISSKLTSFLEENIKDIVVFLLETNKEKTKKIKKRMNRSPLEHPNPKLAALILLLLQRFKEETLGIFTTVDETANEDDIPNLCTIPNTPHLIIAGHNIFQYRQIFFSVDSTLMGATQTLVEGFSLLFGSYFVFNLEYDAKAQITLEFFQRCVADINPARGNKRPKKTAGGHFSAYSVHPALTKLDSKFEDYFAEHENMESEGSSIDDQ